MKTLRLFVFPLLITLFGLLSTQALAVDVDLSFHPRVQTSTYLGKNVNHLLTLPDGKIIAAGHFNNYNGQPVGGLVRLNADGTLDPTFNNHVLVTGIYLSKILVQPDGKLVLLGYAPLIAGENITYIGRLHANGDLDTSFSANFVVFSATVKYDAKIDASGRLVVLGRLGVTQNGATVERNIIRLNDDGTIDASFDQPPGFSPYVQQISLQGDKVLYIVDDAGTGRYRLHRLNENGSPDLSFVPPDLGNASFVDMATQADGKVLLLENLRLRRVNADGSTDAGFQVPEFPGPAKKILLADDGKISLGYGTLSPVGMKVVRFLPDGSPDPAFTSYQYLIDWFLGQTLLPDGGMLLGDMTYGAQPTSRFTKLLPNGLVDTAFNDGKMGFQQISPCKIKTIAVFPDGRILFAGAFDVVDDVARTKIAMLNDDGTLDVSFQIATSGPGNYFTDIRDFYNVVRAGDGKMLISGNFEYRLNGLPKNNIVRLNADGSIDPTFDLTLPIDDASVNSGGGTNPLLERPDSQILVGTSRAGDLSTILVPTLLNSNGSRNAVFSPTLLSDRSLMAIYSIALQPDGKIVITGRTTIPDVGGNNINRGFVARLNADGTIDPAFQIYEPADAVVVAASLLTGGQMVAVNRSATHSTIVRLNSNGSVDGTFNTGAVAHGKVNALAITEDGEILLGGLFSSVAGQARRNFALLNSDGTLGEDPGSINDEILCITFDNDGRVLIGGSFTSIRNGSEQVAAPYLARLTVSAAPSGGAPFDYDGDGRTDVSVFRPSSSSWYLDRSTGGFQGMHFGASGDRPVPADYDGDGKTDIAVYRPESGVWYIVNSGNGSVTYSMFGLAEDLPTPADYDGDGRADISVYRPSNGTWYRLNSSNGAFVAVPFGQDGDRPTVGDFDGDGKADIGVWRPSNGDWYHIRSSNGSTFGERFGTTTDKIVPADYDGDGKTDMAVYRPSDGAWHIRNSSNATYTTSVFGLATDIPVPGDFDGDGKADVAVFRPSSGTWYIKNSSNGSFTSHHWGTDGDIPTPAAFN